MHNTELRNFILEHENWEELLVEPPYALKIQREDGYILFKYNQLASDFTIPLVREARGIIFEESTLECVCRAFDKFGNYGEDYAPKLDWEHGISVQDKIDGSLMKAWYHKGRWHLSTNGQINAYMTPTGDALYPNFGMLFERALQEYGFGSFDEFAHELLHGTTYMFELATEKNRVVIPYDGYHIYYLGQRNLRNMQEACLQDWFDDFDLPKLYHASTVEDVENMAKELPWDQEGYVCVDKHFNRIKVKSPSYVRAHFARNNNVITTKRLIDVVLRNEINEFCIYCEDYKNVVVKIAQKMKDLEDVCMAALHDFLDDPKPSRKNLEMLMRGEPDYVRHFVFLNYDKAVSFKEYTAKWNVDKWERILNV